MTTPQEPSAVRNLHISGDLVSSDLVGSETLLESEETFSDGTQGPARTASAGESEHIATRFVIRSGDRIAVVRVEDVDTIEADGNYVRVHVRNGSHRLRGTIRALAARLDSAQFVRIHKSTIVNLDRVREIQSWFGGDYVAILLDGRQMRVSRTYARELLRPIR